MMRHLGQGGACFLAQRNDRSESRTLKKPSFLGNPVTQALVGVIMGSRSDWNSMQNACNILEELGIPYEKEIVSAHRTPDKLYTYAKSAAERGLKVLIAGAGGAAHLPGMAASKTHLPVLGVPIKSSTLNGVDSLLSIVQMPRGIPVGTLSIGDAGAVNAGIMAARILALQDPAIGEKLEARRAKEEAAILADEL